MTDGKEKSERIRALNDQFRKDPHVGHGRVMLTASVSALGGGFTQDAVEVIATFKDFTEDNDPHGEHDFGIVTVADVKLYWKIDYYDLDQHYGSEDPSDPSKTCRVMTIMLPEDY